MKRKVFFSLLSTILMFSIVSGCSGNVKKSENLVSAKKLTADIQDKYKDDEKYEYAAALKDVERDYTFSYKVSDAAQENFLTFSDSWGDIFKVYKDSTFSQEVAFAAKRENGVLNISPYRKAEYAIPDEELGGYLNDQGEWKDWGNAPQYYLVQYYDLDTGLALEKPIVTSFTIKTEINSAPKVSLTISDKGIAGLEWEKVKGAKEYVVFEFNESQEGKSSGRYLKILTTTKETSWEDTSDDVNDVNKNFRTSYESADTIYGELLNQLKKGEITQENFDNASIKAKEMDSLNGENIYLGVIAINKNGGTSKVSNLIDKRKAASQIPYSVALNMNEGGIRANGDNSKVQVDREINLVSSHAWITMCDGSAVQKLINYNTKKVKKDTIQIYSTEDDDAGNIKMDENGNPVNFSVEDVDCINLPFEIEGTSFKGYAQITNYDDKNYKNELKELKKHQDELRNKSGTVRKNENIDIEDSGELLEEVNSDYNINATNALSEYLAIHMLNGSTIVNLDNFKESQDQNYLVDAWYEAVYQNPLILGVEGIQMDSNNNLLISYNQDKSTQFEKQEEIQEKVKKIISEIIKSDMSDYEKEEAINNYLCSNAEYDNEALKNAEKNNFKSVDEEFNDSFTAYGILINNKGVCASYAAAFQLLAEEAGLQSIVVTGNLDGTLPHAWNRVKINEQWCTLDVTNNDNEFFSNGLFNLSDSMSAEVLVEDDLYIMNDKLTEYTATNDNDEYYRKNNKYYDLASISDIFITELQKQDSVTLRTDYTLSESDFYQIALQVKESKNYSNLKGGYFMGVVTLQK